MSAMLPVGVAVVDVTPPAGLAMEGFAVRKLPATGAHDPLTVRALAVGETALVTADVIGLPATLSARARRAAGAAAESIVLHATHTHGGPATLPGRLSGAVDAAWMSRLEAAIGEALASAFAARRPARLAFSRAEDPDVARNRRRADGPVDRALTALWVLDEDGAARAVLINYACHPVVLGPDNRLWTADYPHFTRAKLEAESGAVALFLTGCVGDVNTGHSPAASMSLAPRAERSFAAAERIGGRIAERVSATSREPLGADASAAEAWVDLPFQRDGDVSEALAPVPARVSLLNWGGLRIVGFPGEIFAATGLEARARLGGGAVMPAGFCEDNPGYVPPAEEYARGGYEVAEAHLYYGAPAAFAPGAAEALVAAAAALAADAPLR